MRSVLDSVVLVMAKSPEVWGGWRSPGVGGAREMKGATRRPPRCVCEDWKPLPAHLPDDAKLGMGHRDVFGPALERRIFRGLKPFEREFALFDPFDGGRAKSLRTRAFRSNISRAPARRPEASPRGWAGAAMAFSGLLVDAAMGFAALGGLLSSEAVEAAAGGEEVAPWQSDVLFMFCSDAGFASARCWPAGRGFGARCLARVVFDAPIDLRRDRTDDHSPAAFENAFVDADRQCFLGVGLDIDHRELQRPGGGGYCPPYTLHGAKGPFARAVTSKRRPPAPRATRSGSARCSFGLSAPG